MLGQYKDARNTDFRIGGWNVVELTNNFKLTKDCSLLKKDILNAVLNQHDLLTKEISHFVSFFAKYLEDVFNQHQEKLENYKKENCGDENDVFSKHFENFKRKQRNGK